MEAIDALVNKQKRLLIVQRTGWGKSSVYFIEATDRLGFRVLTINSTNRDQWPQLQRAVRANDADALLISPERLTNDDRRTLQTIDDPFGTGLSPMS